MGRVIRHNTPGLLDFGQIEVQINMVNQQWGSSAEQLRPVGIAIGAIIALAATTLLIRQACTEEGFDAWFPHEASSNRSR